MDSTEGTGTSFRVYLPLSDPPPGTEGEKTPLPLTKGIETILYTEDDLAVGKVTLRMLKKLGYTVLKASTPQDAIALAKQYKDRINLLFSDIVMPGMDGMELAAKIKRILPDIKVLFTSGYPVEQLVQHGMNYDDIQILQKPFRGQELAEAIHRALSSS